MWDGLQQQMQAPSQQGVASVGRRCYIMNLAWETTWQTLKDHFRQVRATASSPLAWTMLLSLL